MCVYSFMHSNRSKILFYTILDVENAALDGTNLLDYSNLVYQI